MVSLHQKKQFKKTSLTNAAAPNFPNGHQVPYLPHHRTEHPIDFKISSLSIIDLGIIFYISSGASSPNTRRPSFSTVLTA